MTIKARTLLLKQNKRQGTVFIIFLYRHVQYSLDETRPSKLGDHKMGEHER